MNRAERRRQAKEQAKQQSGQTRTISIEEYLQLGVQHHQRREFQQAETVYRQILSQNPRHVDALQLLGAIAAETARWADAIKLIKRSLDLNEEQPAAWHNISRAYFMVGQFHSAIEACTKAVEYNPTNADAYYNRGNARIELKQFREALDDYSKALEIDPKHIDAKRNKALTYKELREYDPCIEILEEAVNEFPGDADLRRTLGLCYRDIGELGKTEILIDEAIFIEPTLFDAHYDKSVVKKYESADDEHIKQMESLLEEHTAHRALLFLHFGLAKAYDDVGDYAKAFHHYDLANGYKRKEREYSTEQVRGYFNKLKHIFSKEFIEQHAWEGELETTPIFIVGMPRSGTTLVEQIIASHSLADGAGELDDLHLAITGNPWEKRKDYLEVVPEMSTEQFRALGDAYLESVKRFGTPTYLCDKMPRNCHHVAMMKLMMPNAKVIYCKRDPMDTCVSIYRKLFFGNQPFAYDQKEVAEHYLLTDDLMQYWSEVMPGFVHTLDYEKLVDQPEETIRDMLSFCGMEYEEGCLNFHTNKRAVHTASAQQIRKPLYKDAVSGWKRYSDHIQPMIEILKPESA